MCQQAFDVFRLEGFDIDQTEIADAMLVERIVNASTFGCPHGDEIPAMKQQVTSRTVFCRIGVCVGGHARTQKASECQGITMIGLRLRSADGRQAWGARMIG